MAKRLLLRPLPRQLQIMAAIYSMGNGKYVLKAVRRGKNGWGKAGVNDTTAPF